MIMITVTIVAIVMISVVVMKTSILVMIVIMIIITIVIMIACHGFVRSWQVGDAQIGGWRFSARTNKTSQSFSESESLGDFPLHW